MDQSAHIAKLETNIEHMTKDIAEIKEMMRSSAHGISKTNEKLADIVASQNERMLQNEAFAQMLHKDIVDSKGDMEYLKKKVSTLEKAQEGFKNWIKGAYAVVSAMAAFLMWFFGKFVLTVFH